MPGSPLISIVIPVYGVASYLPECLDSILGAGRGRAGRGAAGIGAIGSAASGGGAIEVIAIDDASPDDCGQILDDRAAADSRLRVVHLTANGGPGSARNTGLGLATGEYVWFVDGDDRLSDGGLAAVQDRLTELGARATADDSGIGAPAGPDVLLIDWAGSYPGGRTEPSPGRDLLRQVPATGCTLAQLPRLIDLTMTSWSKLLRREFLVKLGVPFAPGIHEDVLVTCAALLTAESIAAATSVCYCYRRDRPGSFLDLGGPAHLAIFASYERVFGLLDARRAAGAPVSDAVAEAVFERAIWHYTTVLQAGGGLGRAARGGLGPHGARRRFFARMHEDFLRYVPAGYRQPPGARGLKFALVQRGSYLIYSLLEPMNQVRVAVGRLAARRG